MMVMRVFKLTSPKDKEFYAAIVQWRDGVAVISTRDGKWDAETKIHFTDLMSPEQDLAEWDVKQLRNRPEDRPAMPSEAEIDAMLKVAHAV